jgi:hypothetical protein
MAMPGIRTYGFGYSHWLLPGTLAPFPHTQEQSSLCELNTESSLWGLEAVFYVYFTVAHKFNLHDVISACSSSWLFMASIPPKKDIKLKISDAVIVTSMKELVLPY